MSRLRSAYLAVALLLGAPVLLFLGAARYVQAQLPAPQGERVRGPHGLVGVQTGAWTSSYAWVIPSANGVILVDAGLDPAARALLREIGRREVQAVLLTHGHVDRVAGLSALPEAEIWADEEAIAAIRGETRPRGWLARAMAAAVAPVAPRGALTPIGDLPDRVGEFEIDGERFHVVRVPGHGAGSVAWLWEGVLFTGDAVHGGSPLSLPPAPLSDDPAEARGSLEHLLPLDFDAIADANTGLTAAARPALFRLANQPLTEPTIRVATRSAAAEGVQRGEVVTARGTLVRTPVPDVRGEQPDLLVTDNGDLWRLSNAPDPELARWDGQAVRVEGIALPAGAGPGRPVEVRAISADDARPAPADRPLTERVGEIVEVTGRVVRFRPLAARALWGEGIVALGASGEGVPPEDAEEIPLSAPVSLAAEGATVTLMARVARDNGGPIRLVALPRASVPPAPPVGPPPSRVADRP